MATFGSLRAWADTWLPEDPEMLERDPDVVLGWLAGRVSPTRTPRRRVVLEIRLHHRFDRRYWLVLQHGTEPYGCLTDPLLEETRYVYLECSMPAVLALARGRGDWSEALQDGSVKAFGDPTLVRRLPRWFRPVPAAAARRIRDQRESFRSPADSERVRR
jgi:hypothetical protein